MRCRWHHFKRASIPFKFGTWHALVYWLSARLTSKNVITLLVTLRIKNALSVFAKTRGVVFNQYRLSALAVALAYSPLITTIAICLNEEIV
jgi:hypothetical protein